MRRLTVLLSTLVTLSLACATLIPGDSGDEPGRESASVPGIPAVEDGIFITGNETRDPSLLYTGLNLAALESYLATYEIQFRGSYIWRYNLIIRSDGQSKEISIHIEGVRVALNPGDLRIVTDGTTTWMTGPGTDNECFFYPSSVNLGAILITPDIIVSPGLIEPLLTQVGKETQLDVETTRYTLNRSSVGNWQNVELELWLSAENSATLRYDMQANGADPAFDAGNGLLHSQLIVHEIGPQTIEPVLGCDIGVPLPQDATDITRFPGVTSFFTNATQDDTISFYQQALPLEGWQETESPVNVPTGIIISYSRGNQSLQIKISNQAGGVVKVEAIIVEG